MMNLVQIQERLKDMPVDAVIAYANGMNPEVPPYVALSELERRKRQDQVMQPAQAPTGTVKDKIEQQVGLAALQQQRQQAAMQQLASMAASPRDASIGGLPVPEQMFSGGGGIVAFADAGKVDAGKVDAEQLLGEQIKRVVPFLERQLPAEVMIDPFTREAALQEMYPERFKASRIPIGQQETERLRELQTAQAAEDARQKQALASRSRMDLFRSLIEGGERSRGQRGIGSVLGGIGSYLGPAMEQVEAAETAIRGRALTRQEAMNKLQNETLAAQRAKEAGDLKAFSDHMNNVAKLQMDLDASKSQPMSALTSGLATLVAQREGDAARIQQQQMANASAMAVAKQYGENSLEAEAARARAKMVEETTARPPRLGTSSFAALRAKTLPTVTWRILPRSKRPSAASNTPAQTKPGNLRSRLSRKCGKILRTKRWLCAKLCCYVILLRTKPILTLCTSRWRLFANGLNGNLVALDPPPLGAGKAQTKLIKTILC